jgi:hypothetical protein
MSKHIDQVFLQHLQHMQTLLPKWSNLAAPSSIEKVDEPLKEKPIIKEPLKQTYVYKEPSELLAGENDPIAAPPAL